MLKKLLPSISVQERPYSGSEIYSDKMRQKREDVIFTLLRSYYRNPTRQGGRVLGDALKDYVDRTLPEKRDSLLVEIADSPDFTRASHPEDEYHIDDLREIDLEDLPEVEPDEAA